MYIGETARKDRYRIVGKVKHRRPQRDAYLITLATNEKNLLDIYPANTMLWRYFYKSSILIVGIAGNHEEAVELACHMIAQVYRETGGFDVRDYFEEHGSRKQ